MEEEKDTDFMIMLKYIDEQTDRRNIRWHRESFTRLVSSPLPHYTAVFEIELGVLTLTVKHGSTVMFIVSTKNSDYGPLINDIHHMALQMVIADEATNVKECLRELDRVEAIRYKED